MSSNDKPSVTEIKSAISNIKTIIKNIEMRGIIRPADKEDYFWTNQPAMMNRYPFLISQLCSNTDNQMLDIMVKQLEAIENSNLSSNTENTNNIDKSLTKANEKIGKILADNFLPKKK